MKAGFYQFYPEFGNREKNVKKVREVLHDCKADLIVLPELFNTGYQFINKDEVVELAEEIPGGFTTNALIEISKENNLILIGGICENYKGKLYNSSVLVSQGNYIGRYRKIHLFFEEKLFFEPGDEGYRVFNVNGINIGMMICFDWIFPEAARILSLNGADIIVHPSNLVLPYCQEAMKTRSIENSVFTVTTNRIGSEKRGGKDELIFTGGSQVTGIRGEILMRAGVDEEKLGFVNIEPFDARDKKVTQYNHVLKDRRQKLYSDLTRV